MAAKDLSPETQVSTAFLHRTPEEAPIIDDSETFYAVVKKLAGYIARLVDSAYTYEQLRISHALKPLVSRLSDDCHHPAIVAALLWATN